MFTSTTYLATLDYIIIASPITDKIIGVHRLVIFALHWCYKTTTVMANYIHNKLFATTQKASVRGTRKVAP